MDKIYFTSYQEFKETILRSKRGLHNMVAQKLDTIFKELYPDAFVRKEPCSGIVGGRADMIAHLKGKTVHIEFIASKGRVHDNVKRLKESHWDLGIVILMDDEIEPKVSEKYFDELRYLEISLEHFPYFKLSDVLVKEKEEGFKKRLKETLESTPKKKGKTVNDLLLVEKYKEEQRKVKVKPEPLKKKTWKEQKINITGSKDITIIQAVGNITYTSESKKKPASELLSKLKDKYDKYEEELKEGLK